MYGLCSKRGGPSVGNSFMVLSQAIGAGTVNSSHVDKVLQEIDTTGLAPPANTLTGTLNIQAQAV